MKIEQWASEMFAEFKIKASSSLSDKKRACSQNQVSDMIEPIITTGIFPCKEENFTCKKFSVIKGIPHCQWAFTIAPTPLKLMKADNCAFAYTFKN